MFIELCDPRVFWIVQCLGAWSIGHECVCLPDETTLGYSRTFYSKFLFDWLFAPSFQWPIADIWGFTIAAISERSMELSSRSPGIVLKKWRVHGTLVLPSLRFSPLVPFWVPCNSLCFRESTKIFSGFCGWIQEERSGVGMIWKNRSPFFLACFTRDFEVLAVPTKELRKWTKFLVSIIIFLF